MVKSIDMEVNINNNSIQAVAFAKLWKSDTIGIVLHLYAITTCNF